jgi:hypothetical protein
MLIGAAIGSAAAGERRHRAQLGEAIRIEEDRRSALHRERGFLGAAVILGVTALILMVV